MMLATPVGGTIGERVVAYFEEFGTIQGALPSSTCQPRASGL
jgi:hypothetical protein